MSEPRTDPSDPGQEQPGMGVSSERVGPTGPGQTGTHGVRDTGPAEPDVDADVPPEQRPGAVEDNPVGIEPVAPYPTLDPRSDETS